ncbi:MULTISPECIES: FAD-dependent oxidoreductase [Microbacterium]|uniref:FAD-dependent oxidoreductase n=1 Tax=Microbacterium wangchenii TaxID=2541726 RepID=A0ABX5SRL4_9MICO|nr:MULTISPECIES: FAD-dependent oxidoreductase [Microbacterium]MCK6066590.1 FAD-dependent oxidoreductase [Microbacterium sp. EYE_512]QBR87925.1 FAD-dependent oxidoreductase [Microbacterium wangchenii]TFV83952.1 FAD-dependent oxidoreductase [Microbacterium sp. dk485]TXK18285.1 FAD-dependent oxidoreductase [Microbacterium wangchenii]
MTTPLWKQDATPVPGTDFEPGRSYDVVVVGAGITGLATAYLLARAGMGVAIVEAGEVGNLATGGNTGKASLLQGTVLSTLRSGHPAGLVRAYVEANRSGQEWLGATADELSVPVVRRTAFTYAQSDDALSSVEAEKDAAREAGVPVRRATRDELDAVPFPLASAVALDDQLSIDPMTFATALARAAVAAGAVLHTGVTVRGAKVLPRAHVQTDDGPLYADSIVLATGMPILDRGGYFAKVHGTRSYCVAFATDGPIPEGMYLSADSPSRSVRAVSAGDGPAGYSGIIVGGAGHPVGRGGSERERVDELVAWARQHLPVGEETHRWSAQDYQSHNLIPFIGAMPRSLGRVRFATGYGKWGLTNGPAAAQRIAAEILGDQDKPQWMTALGTRMTMPSDLARGVAENAKVGRAAAQGWAEAERTPVPVPQPAEGAGVVAQRGGRPVGISTVDGVTRAVDAVCPHMGGVLSWNDEECTWDCPLHASRFQANGARIEGPARSDLKPLS